MQLLLIHSNGFQYKVNEKAISNPEKLSEVIPGEYSTKDSVLIIFVAVEDDDRQNTSNLIQFAVREILQAMKDIKESNLILYPWVHLSKYKPAEPKEALKILNQLNNAIIGESADLKVIRAPFGYYKSFSLNCKGHALAERSKEISSDYLETQTEKKTEITTAISAEEESTSRFYIVSRNGDLIDYKNYSFEKVRNFELFVKYETAKDRTVSEPPKHVETMKNLELIDYELGSDPGNFRILPRGYVVKQLIEKHVINMAIDYGALVLETPIMYSYEHPSLKKYLERFPARQYVVKSGEHDYFLRFAACFGQFLAMSNSIISYKQLPLKVFEMAKSFRREQRGELAGIRRLRAFTMPDLHTIADSLTMAKEEFETQFNLAKQYMKDIEIEFETAFRMTTEFYEENKNWILSLIKTLDKPVLLELFEKRYAYFILKFEFNVVDGQNKAAALSTVQIDVENSERFEIKYTNQLGEDSYPFLLHCSISGSSERVIYGILEEQLRLSNEGGKPTFPLWLSPSQVRILPVSEQFNEEAITISDQLKNALIRAEIDDRDLSLSKKIRAAEKLWTPIILVLGKKETEEKKLSVRYRKERKQEFQSIEEIISYIKENTKGKPWFPQVFPNLVSKQPIFTRTV
ncbi:MAG: threonine--tRNA ligase [Candidatus Heimdallarchaeota archaeon]|nr:threonine--tRNA ligase [Candidatus Heimdallarchaeota archaeon]